MRLIKNLLFKADAAEIAKQVTQINHIIPTRLKLKSDNAQSLAILKYSSSSKMIFDYRPDQARRAEWLEFWRNAKHSGPQQPDCDADINSSKRRKMIYCAGIKGKKIVIAGIFTVRPFFLNPKYVLEAVCLRGPVFDDVNIFREFLPRIVRQFKTLRVGGIRLWPYWQYPEAAQVEDILKENGFKPRMRKKETVADQEWVRQLNRNTVSKEIQNLCEHSLVCFWPAHIACMASRLFETTVS